jgi:hypothetical protein
MAHKRLTKNWLPLVPALLLLVLITSITFLGLDGKEVLAQSTGAQQLGYETILNGAQFEQGLDMAVNAVGEAFVLARAYDTTNDVMVVKLSSSGDVLFTKYLRGSAQDYGTGIAVDTFGDVYVGGWTDSADFPILNASQPIKNGVTRDAFIAKLSGDDGSLIFSTFFGGSRSDQINDLVLDSTGAIYITGQTSSIDFPVMNPYQGSLNLTQCFCDDAFVAKLDSQASMVLYSTYLGGSSTDAGVSLGLDAVGNIYVTGTTHSTDFPLKYPVQASNAGGTWDIFVTRISANGSTLDFSTYLGGSDYELVGHIAVSDSGQVYLTGSTQSLGYPTTPGAFQENFTGGILDCGAAGFGQHNCFDIFVTSLFPGGTLAYSTYLGGGLDDEGRALEVNSAGEAYVVGYTASSDFPGGNGSNFAIILSKLNPTGSNLLNTLAITSPVANAGHGAALDLQGNIYLTGAQNVPSDLYVAKVNVGGLSPRYMVYIPIVIR